VIIALGGQPTKQSQSLPNQPTHIASLRPLDLNKERPPHLVMCEHLFRGEVLEIHVVRKYLCLVGTALEVMAEMLESMNNSQGFFVVDFIVAFSWLEGLGVKSDWM